MRRMKEAFSRKTAITLGSNLSGDFTRIFLFQYGYWIFCFCEGNGYSPIAKGYDWLASLANFGGHVERSLGLLYKIAPARDNPKFRWVTWGAGIASVLWILGSLIIHNLH